MIETRITRRWEATGGEELGGVRPPKMNSRKV